MLEDRMPPPAAPLSRDPLCASRRGASLRGTLRSLIVRLMCVAVVATVAAAPVLAATSNIVANADFESGAVSWTQSSTGGYPIIYRDAALAHTGSWFAWFGAYNDGVDTLYQTLTLGSAGPASLSFWYRVDTQETTASPFDTLSVTVNSATTGEVLASLATLSNVDRTGWVQSPAYDVSAFVGQTVRLVFKATIDHTLWTSFIVDDVALSQPGSANYQGLWWNPAETGWGVNLAHQGDRIYLTWYTYDASGKPVWLAMLASGTAAGTYAGDILELHGPAFSALPFAPAPASSVVGAGTLAFSDADNGTFSYTAKNVMQSKPITRYAFGPQPACFYRSAPDLSGATNFQDLWWDASENGWGINVSHQGNRIYATWYTYDIDGSPLWLASLMDSTAAGTFKGSLLRLAGPPFSAAPFAPAPAATAVGTATLAFANGNAAVWSYNVNAIAGSKPITRYLFAAPAGTLCQ